MTKTHLTLVSVAAVAALSLAPAALAQVNLGTSVKTSVQAKVGSTTVRTQVSATLITRAKGHADQEIGRRVAMLDRLSARIGNMHHISASDQQTLTTNIQSQISSLSDLKAKIDAEADTASLRADIKSIVDSYRIYMIVVPQSTILAAVDRIDGLVSDFNTLGAKLSTRITAAQASEADVSAAQSAYADYQAKVADAHVQASAAQSLVASLKAADAGSQGKAALQNARTKIKAARQDLIAARKDVDAILKDLPKTNAEVHASSSVSASESH